MGKKCKPRVIPEQDGRIIGTICMCQLTMVLSSVALIYLSVAVYAPSHRAFNSGYETTPIMCETMNLTMVSNYSLCNWTSCSEWCLTKSSGFCPQILAIPRRHGSNLTLYGCNKSHQTSCSVANVDLLSKVNCNQDNKCNNMRGLFRCAAGHCNNISEILQCSNKGDGVIIDVIKDSGKLKGNYECTKTRCRKVTKRLECEHICPKIVTGSNNIYISKEFTVLGAQCANASASDPSAPGPAPAPFWIPSDGSLLASCYTYEKNGDTITATDCVNGTVIPPSEFPQPRMNFTQLREMWSVQMDKGNRPRSNRIPRGGIILPSSPLLYMDNNWTKLFINLKGCVNTLKGECSQFLKDYGNDGRNFTYRSRYPCYYKKNDSTAPLLARYDLEETWRELVIAVLVPAILFVVSFTTLCVITRSVKVGDDAKLRCLACCCARPARDAADAGADT